MDTHELDFDPWFAAHADAMRMDGCSFARVTTVDRGAYVIKDRAREALAELSGKLMHQANSPMDRPCVGDWVTANFYNDDTEALIHQVFPRRSFLRRKAPGAVVEFQMIAANVDTAFLVQSCHRDFNPSRLERYLVMAADGRVEPVVLLTKTDLITPEELEEKRAILGAITPARVITCSNITGEGLDAFEAMLEAGRTYCLLGSSGVGKTTLINRILGREAFATRTVSGTGEGTHTTTRRQLVMLDWGALLIDTPGMRELGLIGAGDGVDMGFDAFAALAAQCRYADCTHSNEPDCAVRAAVERGELSGERYASYCKLRKESAFHEMSYLEKRRKDKAFGKFIKTVKKHMQD